MDLLVDAQAQKEEMVDGIMSKERVVRSKADQERLIDEIFGIGPNGEMEFRAGSKKKRKLRNGV